MLFLYFIMQLFCVLVSLFSLYSLVKNDFVLARKSILLQEIFDATFFCSLAFLFFGRIFYIFSNLQFSYFEPLRFFHLIKFPGINFLGGVIGFYLIVFVLFSRKKILGRIFDIYSLSFYSLFIFALSFSSFVGFSLYLSLSIFLLSLVFLGLSVYSYKNYTLKDGSTTLLFFCLISVFTIVSEFSHEKTAIFIFFNVPQLLSFLTFFASSGILLAREGLIKERKKMWTRK